MYVEDYYGEGKVLRVGMHVKVYGAVHRIVDNGGGMVGLVDKVWYNHPVKVQDVENITLDEFKLMVNDRMNVKTIINCRVV